MCSRGCDESSRWDQPASSTGFQSAAGPRLRPSREVSASTRDRRGWLRVAAVVPAGSSRSREPGGAADVRWPPAPGLSGSGKAPPYGFELAFLLGVERAPFAVEGFVV